jgi:hypothetical protein
LAVTTIVCAFGFVCYRRNRKRKARNGTDILEQQSTRKRIVHIPKRTKRPSAAPLGTESSSYMSLAESRELASFKRWRMDMSLLLVISMADDTSLRATHDPSDPQSSE